MDAAQLAQFEELAHKQFDPTTPPNERQQAASQLESFKSAPKYVPQCQYVLEHSSSSYAQMVAVKLLEELMCKHWNSYTSQQHILIRNFALSHLASYADSLRVYVKSGLISLISRMTRLGWFGDSQHREISGEVAKFMQSSPAHSSIGLELLEMLIAEFNRLQPGSTLGEHRKAAVAFRDATLLNAFQMAISTIQRITAGQMVGATEDAIQSLLLRSLKLCVACLSFDFIGTHPDESLEEPGTIQMPSTWRPVIQDPSTLRLFFNLYSSTSPPSSPLVLRALLLLASVRRSLFASEERRREYVRLCMEGITNILETGQGLSDQSNYHEFCKLLGRMKTNNQLSELVETDGFEKWLVLTTNFTLESFKQWKWSSSSIHYLLTLWTRMVAAVPYVKPDVQTKAATLMFRAVPQVIKAYVKARLDSAPVVLRLAEAAPPPGVDAGAGAAPGGAGVLEKSALDSVGVEDLMEDFETLDAELSHLPNIARFDYEATRATLKEAFDSILPAYQEGVQMILSSGHADAATMQRLQLMEVQLAWLVAISGSVVSGHPLYSNSVMHSTLSSLQRRLQGSGSPMEEDGDNDVRPEEVYDADLARSCLQVMQVVDMRAERSQGQSKCDVRLQKAILYFIQHFRQAFIGVQHGMPDPKLSASGASNAVTTKQRVFQRFFKALDRGDHVAVTNAIVGALSNNLRYWPEEEDIVDDTLKIMGDLAQGYSSGKLMLQLDSVQQAMTNHATFEFMKNPNRFRQRTVFYTVLARLVFMMDDEAKFEQFMQPHLITLGQLAQTDLRSPDARKALAGICRDLTGVIGAAHNRRTYGWLFDALHPQHLQLLGRAAEQLADDPGTCSLALKVIKEMATNRAQRIVFSASSADGILLFRHVSAAVVGYTQQLRPLLQSGGSAALDRHQKAFRRALEALEAALLGRYTNFGVFLLYNDPALEQALQSTLAVALEVPPHEMLNRQKLGNSFYAYLHALFTTQIPSLVRLPPDKFTQLLKLNQEGLNSNKEAIAVHAAIAVDSLASQTFLNARKEKPEARALRAQLANHPKLFPSYLHQLFTVLLFGTFSFWPFARPVLAIKLADPAAFEEYRETMIKSQPPDKQEQLREQFDLLMRNVRNNLETSNRDRFAQQMQLFRLRVRAFIAV